MDVLYDNLENYNEETTIAELRCENKELKSKLEEYASNLEILQKDFDKLSSEYKMLELNYSSLLKTARAEVERKALIINNLNIEKDKMVLSFHQNRNADAFRRSNAYVNPNLAQNFKEDRSIKSEMVSKIKENDTVSKIKEIENVSKIKENENVRKPPNTPTKRKEESQLPHRDATTSLNMDLRSRLLNMANTMPRQVDPRIEKSSEIKESIMQPKKEDDKLKSRALIRNRRKSMPAMGYEMEKVSSDDDDDQSSGHQASPGRSKELSRENTYKKHVDRNLSDMKSSRRSETSSFEDRNLGKPLHDAHKSRFSRYDRDKNERQRRYSRDKSFYNNRRRSPNRYEKTNRDYYDDRYHRSEREKFIEVESHPVDRCHWQRNRERINYERNYPREHERLQQPRSQERYHNMKHKIQHSNDESDNKRIKIDSHCSQFEENRRLPDEKEILVKRNIIEPYDNIQFSSCESPDNDDQDESNHQTKEITLVATTKLDDPRICNKKYVLEKNDGKVALSTTEGRNVDMMPLSKTSWGITQVKMPKALVQRPSLEAVQPAKEYMEIEKEVNISLESGEIDDTQNYPKDIGNVSKITKSDVKALLIPNLYESKNIEDSLQKIKSYKITKLKKTVEDNQSGNNIKEITPLFKPIHEHTRNTATLKSTLLSKNSDSAIKNIDEGKPLMSAKSKTLLEQNKQDIFCTKSNNELPFLGDGNLNDNQNYASAKEVVKGDFELSDDDNNEQLIYITKESHKLQLENNENNKIQNSNINTEKHNRLPSEKRVENAKNNKSNHLSGEKKREKDKEPHRKDTTEDDSKKSKSKKKLKHKEPKEQLGKKDSAQASEKPMKKMEKDKESKTKEMKTKFIELFDDSSSLIFPEDLGLVVVPPPTIQLPDRCVPIFEDAQDVDLNALKAATTSNPTEKLHENENNHGSEIIKIRKVDTPVTITQDSVNKINESEHTVNEEAIESIYKNLEPGILEKEDNVVRTVVISTGVQPPILVESEKQELASKTEPQLKNASQALKALATSTPHKVVNVVQTEEVKLPDTSCNSNSSQMVSVENTSAMDHSDTNMVDSQNSGLDVPDVRIIVRRRRKVIKK